MRTISAGLSDAGRKRPHNEDAYYVDDELGLYIVADGVGGRSKGEVASWEAIEQLKMWVYRSAESLTRSAEACAGGDDDARWEVRRVLEGGVQWACYMVFGIAEQDPEKRGMSTTISVAFIRSGLAFAAHVGDSRVYRLRGGRVLQITEDHTLINYKLKRGLITEAEARRSDRKNVITRAVGHRDYVQIDTADVDAAPGDRFLLCSDGLHNYLHADEEVVELIGDGPLETCVEAAIGMANARGGKDNITAIAVEVV